MSKPDSLQSRLLTAGGQMALIVLSVLLAFAVNAWRQQAADDALAAQALDGLRAEFASNRTRAEEAAAYRADLIAQLDSGGAGIQLRPAFILDNAWESALAADALRHLPYTIVATAGRIHEMQEVYREIAQAGGNLLYFGNVFGNSALPSHPAGFVPILEDMVFFERDLVRRYDDALALMDSLEVVR